MRIAAYSSESDNRPVLLDTTPAELAETFQQPRERTPCTVADCASIHPQPGAPRGCFHKSGMAFSPGIVRPGGKRCLADVEAVSCGVFDLDHQTQARVEAQLAKVMAGGESFILHSTHSHNPAQDDCCLRLIVFYSREVTPAEDKILREFLTWAWQLDPDPATRDSCRLYYLPRVPSDSVYWFYSKLDGELLDVDGILAYMRSRSLPPALLAAPATSQAALGAFLPPSPAAGPVSPAPNAPAAVQGPSCDDFDGPVVASTGPVDMAALRESLRTVARPSSKALMAKVLAGQPLAERGARDVEINRAMSVIASRLPMTAPDDAIMEILRPSLRALENPEGENWEAVALMKLRRARGRKVLREAEHAAYLEAVRQQFCQQAAAIVRPEDLEPGEDPSAYYTQAQVERWAQEQGCGSVDEFRRRWIIQRGRAFWVFANGRYQLPIGKDDLALSLPRDLARASKGFISLTVESSKGGTRAATPAETLQDYGTVARTVEASLSLQKSYYSSTDQAFFEAVCPLRKIAPVEHPEIQQWLLLLGGAEASLLLDWVATITALDKQTCGLFIAGASGAGKTLLAHGLAKLWTVGAPSELEYVLDGFNEVIAQCPLCFGDEKLPAVKQVTAQLRRLVGSSARNLNRKHLTVCSLRGAMRLIVAANNENMLDVVTEDLNSADTDAVAGRFLFLQPAKDAADYLLSLNGAPDAWITQDLLAEHALWLRKTRRVVPAGRFLVSGGDSNRNFYDRLAVQTPMANAIFEFLIKSIFAQKVGGNQVIAASMGGANRARNYIFLGEGECWVATEAFTDKFEWQQNVPGLFMPSIGKLGKTLSNLSWPEEADGSRLRLPVGDKRVGVHRLRVNLLRIWIRQNGFGDLEDLENRLNAPNPAIRDTLQRRAISQRGV